MGMDIDYIAANRAIEDLIRLLAKQSHGEREKIADDIIEFVEKMETKYGE